MTNGGTVPDTYVPPVLYDYGSLVKMTQGAAFRGLEDGGSKVLEAHHSGPLTP
jgi:hypothetical protein